MKITTTSTTCLTWVAAKHVSGIPVHFWIKWLQVMDIHICTVFTEQFTKEKAGERKLHQHVFIQGLTKRTWHRILKPLNIQKFHSSKSYLMLQRNIKYWKVTFYRLNLLWARKRDWKWSQNCKFAFLLEFIPAFPCYIKISQQKSLLGSYKSSGNR